MYRASKIVLLMVFIFAFQPVNAQAQKPVCNLAALLPAPSDKTALVNYASIVSDMNIACNGFTLTGIGKIIAGPVVLPDGLWRVTLYSKDTISFSADALEGDCGQEKNASNLFADIGNTKTGLTVFTLLAVEGCKVIFNPYDLSEEPWTITIEPLK